MGVYKDNWNGYDGEKWRVSCYYIDWQGNRKRHDKRGFATKKEALAYEREYLAKTSKDINMGFNTFIDIYMADMKPQIKLSTYLMKINVIDTHIRPYFENKTLSSISTTDILQWQNELLSQRDEQGKGYSPTYLRTINNQISAIFNHAVRYYDLPKNPCAAHKKMGKAKAKEMDFWTKDEYLRFAETMKSKPVSYYAFQVLYWTGIRCGELLALTKEDFDFEKKTLRINKTFQVINGKDNIGTPKTEESNRVVDIPEFLCHEISDYIDMLYKVNPKSRIFTITKSYLHHEMNRGCKECGVKRIRIHDLRHSSASLLIDLGYNTTQLAKRLGHSETTVTELYAHLYPSAQKQMANRLNQVFMEQEVDNDNEEIRVLAYYTIDYNGWEYKTIFGGYENGTWICIPEWHWGCKAGTGYWSTSYNAEQLEKAGAPKDVAIFIAKYIEEHYYHGGGITDEEE